MKSDREREKKKQEVGEVRRKGKSVRNTNEKIREKRKKKKRNER